MLPDHRDFEWTREFWQGWRESDNPYRRYKSQRDRDILSGVLELRDGHRLLEVGCGYGWISQTLWRAAQIEWFGIDRSTEMISHLRNIEPVRANRSSVADACQLSFRNDQFDVVVCTGVLMHIRDDLGALNELVRVLRPGGQLICSINNALSPYSVGVQAWNSRKKGFVQNFRSPNRFRSILCKAGLRTIEFVGDGIVATVPIRLGGFNFPPTAAFRSLSRMDKWAAERFPWLAYEVWFSAEKVARQCT